MQKLEAWVDKIQIDFKKLATQASHNAGMRMMMMMMMMKEKMMMMVIMMMSTM